MPQNSSLLKQFMDAQNMNAFAQGNLFGFNLEGTLPLMRALIGCVKKQVPSASLKDPEAQPPRSGGHPQRARSGGGPKTGGNKGVGGSGTSGPGEGSFH
jgi:hypothetical protein